MRNLKARRRGHDTSGYMVTDDDTLEIVSFHNSLEAANKKIKKMLR